MKRFDARDGAAFRATFGRFVTGVAVVTCRPPEGAPLGVTINALASVSLEPALALFCLEERAASLSSFLSAGHFALNILAEGQDERSARFAVDHSMTEVDPQEVWQSGAPVLTDALAVADCTLMDTFGGGDHVILLGRVLEVGWRQGVDPLVYYSGGYRRMEP